LLLAFISSSLAIDNADVAFLNATLDFDLLYRSRVYSASTAEFSLVPSSFKGFGKWKFFVHQHARAEPNPLINIKMHCAEDCPTDNSHRVKYLKIVILNEGQEIFERFQPVHEMTWEDWKNPGTNFTVGFNELKKIPYGERLTASIILYTSNPEDYNLRVKEESALQKYSDVCMRSMLANEKPVTLQFKDGNVSTYPSFLKEHSVVLKEFLERMDSNEESAISDFKKFPKQTGAMMLEVFCYERVMTVLEDRGQYVSELASLYELGQQFQMDKVIVASISAFASMKPRPSGTEIFAFTEVLSRKTSFVGDYFLNSVLQVSIDSQALSKLPEQIQKA
jgi:hypothetical protein